MATALIGATLFDGDRLRDGQAVLIEAGRIAGVLPEAKLPKSVEKQSVSGLLAPGFIDVQVNGGGGVLFNETRTIDGIAAIGAAHRRYGTTGFLPTLITDTPESMGEAIKAADAAMQARTPGVLGIHLEGPFLNPERKGIHRADLMRTIGDPDLAMIDLPAGGRVLVTLAPEKTEPSSIARLTQSGIIVAAGHTKADVATIRRAQEAGLTGITHLFNAMPPLMNREPGPVGAALDDRTLWCGLIVDMHHVSATALRVALAARGPERMMLVTDAMPSVGSTAASFDLLGERITLVDGALCERCGDLGRIESRHGERRSQHRAASRRAGRGCAAHGRAQSGDIPAPGARARPDRAGLSRRSGVAGRRFPCEGDLDLGITPRRKVMR